MNIIAHVNTLDKVLSRLAQSVERQTLRSVLGYEGYLNVVGSSPTLGAKFFECYFLVLVNITVYT